MTAHVITHHAPALRPVRVRRRRPGPRVLAAFLVLLAASLVASAPGQVAEAAHAACTLGNPEHVTCGEALFLLGYP